MTYLLVASAIVNTQIQAVDLMLSAELWQKYGMEREWTDRSSKGVLPFSENIRFVEINQSLVKGDQVRAEQVLRKTGIFYGLDGDSQTTRYHWLGGPANKSVSAQTAYLIYVHSVNQYLEPGSNVKLIYHRLKSLEDLDLVGKGPPDFWGGGYRNMHDFMKEFKATAFAKVKGESKAEQAVLDLSMMENMDYENDPHVLKVCEFGLKALPYLANEVEDIRLTKCFIPDFGKNPDMILPVNYVAKILVSKLTGSEIGWDKMTKHEVLNWYRNHKASDTIAKVGMQK